MVAGINAAGVPGVTASLGGTGLRVAAGPAANVTINDAAGGTLASDLGIKQTTGAGAGVSVIAADAGAVLTDQTPLADLRGGAGLDPAGFTITVGTKSKTIDLTGLATVQDLVNAVNTAGLGASAAISSDGSHVDLTNGRAGREPERRRERRGDRVPARLPHVRRDDPAGRPERRQGRLDPGRHAVHDRRRRRDQLPGPPDRPDDRGGRAEPGQRRDRRARHGGPVDGRQRQSS